MGSYARAWFSRFGKWAWSSGPAVTGIPLPLIVLWRISATRLFPAIGLVMNCRLRRSLNSFSPPDPSSNRSGSCDGRSDSKFGPLVFVQEGITSEDSIVRRYPGRLRNEPSLDSMSFRKTKARQPRFPSGSNATPQQYCLSPALSGPGPGRALPGPLSRRRTSARASQGVSCRKNWLSAASSHEGESRFGRRPASRNLY